MEKPVKKKRTFDEYIDDIKYKVLVASGIVGIGVSSSAIMIMNSDPAFTEPHGHIYETEDEFQTRLNSERRNYYKTFIKGDKIDKLSEKEALINEVAIRGNLIPIDENIDKLLELEDSIHDYTEYEYSKRVETTTKDINGIEVTKEETVYDYSKDSNVQNQTGNTRTITHAFVGYNIYEKEDGRIFIIRNEPADSIEELIDGGSDYVVYGQMYYGYNKETKEIIGYNDEMGEKQEEKTLVLK